MFPFVSKFIVYKNIMYILLYKLHLNISNINRRKDNTNPDIRIDKTKPNSLTILFLLQ